MEKIWFSFCYASIKYEKRKRGSGACSSLDENEYEIKRKVFAGALKKGTLESFLLFYFSPKTFARLFILRKVKPSHDS